MHRPFNPDNMKRALNNVLASIKKRECDEVVAALDVALKEHKFGPPYGLMTTLAIVTRQLLASEEVASEQLVQLLELLEQPARRKGPGRPAKEIERSVAEALTVVAIDVLMSTQRMSLDHACREVAKRTRGHFNSKQLKVLRFNIKRGPSHASPEAVECYNWHLRKEHNPCTTDIPATVTLPIVDEIWANSPKE